LRKYKISAYGADAEQEVQTKINQYFNKVKNMIDTQIGMNSNAFEDNMYKLDKKNSQSW